METQVEVGNIFINDLGENVGIYLSCLLLMKWKYFVMRTKILCRKQWMSIKAVRVK